MTCFRKLPLTLKMTLITLLVGIVTWALLDPIHRKSMKRTFGEQLKDRLEQEAYENRMLFDGYVDRFMQSTKILISQRGLQDYVNSPAAKWESLPPGKDRTIYHNEPPAWLPKSSVIRTLPDVHYIFLLDKKHSLREVYMKYPETPPAELLDPVPLLIQMSHQQAFMTEINGKPYIMASESLRDDHGNSLSTLLLAAPLDNQFLLESQGVVSSNKLVALVSIEPAVILSSSHPETLTPGTELKALQGSYLYTGKGFFDYGSSDLRINFMTFLPVRPYDVLSESILKEEWVNRIITALMLILSFSALMFWITKRVQNLTGKVRDAEVKLKIEQPPVRKGDELEVLEQRFLALSEEVLSSHESIKEQARMLRQERDRAQNYLDTAASIFLVTDTDHNVILINKRGCEILGYREEELIGRGWFETILPADARENAKSDFQEFISNKTGSEIYLESPVRTRKGEQRTIGWHATLLKDEAGNIIGVLGSGEDVTDRRKAEEELLKAHKMLESRVKDRTSELEKANVILNAEINQRTQIEKALRKSEHQLEKAQAIAHIGNWEWDIQSNKVSWSNEVYRIYGYRPGEIEPDYEAVKKAMHPDSIKIFLESIDSALRGERPFEMEYNFFRRDGRTSILHTKGEVIRDSAGSPVKMFGVVQDITERKGMEDRIRASLKEKEVLLQEIHHRVKNNMTVISSLLKLQADKVTDEYYKELFNESTNRIKTMALIHEKLYRSEDLASIVFSDYLRDMMDNIMCSYEIRAHKVRLNKELDRITLALDTAIPCGLIVNELLSNSLKYAFPDSMSGEIRVTLRKNNDKVELTVGDNGVGLPPDLDFRNPRSLGLNIVNALVGQIRGNIELHREQGTEFLITFSSDNY
ncbi:MAG: PAS domain S-box protein [Nitrospiraceae bacterium]|nr:MAG: PAS domain S-box protein [Nitrospiraceae bacterium]